MTIPDYSAAVSKVGLWIAAATNLETRGPSATMFLEPALPPLGPDTVATVFETSGVWATDRDQMVFTLLLVTRAPLLAASRALSIAALMGAVNGWINSPKDEHIITNLRVSRLPQLQPRDERNRVILESLLEMSIYAPFNVGVDQ